MISVDEGALPGLADELVAPDAEALVRASTSGTRREIQILSAEQIATSVVDLYDRVRAA